MIKIGFTGDVMIGRLVNAHLRKAAPSYIWGDLLPHFLGMDLNLINLEAALTYSTDQVPKVFNFKSDPEHVQSLKEASIHVVNLANNHVLDFGEKGLLETLNILDTAHIQHVGAGTSLAQARVPVIMAQKGITIGILGCTDNEPSWAAKHNHCGVHYVDVGDFNAIASDIKALRPRVDILILSMHWGPNMCERPSKGFMQFAHQLIDAGVDIFHGHSAHIFQGVEVYKDRLILYDTGDFIDDYYVDPYLRNDRSFFFEVTVSKNGVESLNMIPVLISKFQVNRSFGEEAEETMHRMMMLSQKLGTKIERANDRLNLSIHH